MSKKLFGSHSINISKALNRIEEERFKRRIVSQASHQIINILNKITKSNTCKIIKSDTSKLVGKKSYSGLLDITASVIDCGFEKQILIPIEIKSSLVYFPNVDIIKNKLESIKVEDVIHKKTVENTSKFIEDLKEREEKAKKISREGFEIRKKEREKKAVEIEIPGGGVSSLPFMEVAKSIRYPKVNLPASIKEGDILNFAGRRYEVKEDKSQLQGKPSSDWLLVLIDTVK